MLFLMEKACIHITGTHAIMLARAARIGEVVAAEPADCTRIHSLPNGFCSLQSLGLDTLVKWLKVTENNPLRLFVPHKNTRRWYKGIHFSALSLPVPNGGFLRLVSGSDKEKALELPADLDVIIDSPSLSFLCLTHALGQRAKSGNEAEQATRLRLIEFAIENCGAYVRDPFKPRNVIAHYDRPKEDTRFCTLQDMTSFVDEAHALPGSKLAKQLLGHAIDGSGSGMETYLNLALCDTPKLGGLSMKKPLVNKELEVDDALRPLLKHQSIRPDMQWPSLRTLVEYLGDKEHESKKARIEDKDRLQDYTTAGYLSFFLMFDDVKSAQALNNTAQMIARGHMKHGLHNELYRIRHLIKQPDFQTRQNKLIATLLPPLSKEE